LEETDDFKLNLDADKEEEEKKSACAVNYDQDDDDDDRTIIRTEPAEDLGQKTGKTASRRNKYELFEEYLGFLSVDSAFVLNPVLLGYWCNLFKSLLKTHAY